jgi:hypothetical protein
VKSTSLNGAVEKLFGLLLFDAIARIALTKIIGSYPQFLGKSASSSGISLPIIALFALGFDLECGGLVARLIIGGMIPQR